MKEENFYNLIIVGAGPAGLTASIYASRFNLKNLVLASSLGGTVSEIFILENYPGIKSTNGAEIIKKIQEQVEKLGAEIRIKEVIDIKPKEGKNIVITKQGDIYTARAVILALGTTFQRLCIPGEKEFFGKGVSYCATCDGPFFKDKIVGVVGGGNSATQASLLLAQHCSKVFIIYRKEKMRAQEILINRLKSNPKIQRIKQTNVLEICGKEKVEKVILDKKYKGSNELILDGLFIEIGTKPSNALPLKMGIELDKEGLIIIDEGCRTNIKGIFAAGDITTGSNKLNQIITAAAEGAIAATSVYDYLKSV